MATLLSTFVPEWPAHIEELLESMLEEYQYLLVTSTCKSWVEQWPHALQEARMAVRRRRREELEARCNSLERHQFTD